MSILHLAADGHSARACAELFAAEHPHACPRGETFHPNAFFRESCRCHDGERAPTSGDLSSVDHHRGHVLRNAFCDQEHAQSERKVAVMTKSYVADGHTSRTVHAVEASSEPCRSVPMNILVQQPQSLPRSRSCPVAQSFREGKSQRSQESQLLQSPQIDRKFVVARSGTQPPIQRTRATRDGEFGTSDVASSLSGVRFQQRKQFNVAVGVFPFRGARPSV